MVIASIEAHSVMDRVRSALFEDLAGPTGVIELRFYERGFQQELSSVASLDPRGAPAKGRAWPIRSLSPRWPSLWIQREQRRAKRKTRGMRRIVLPRSGRDLSAFRVEGLMDGSPVSASCDGRVLEVADALVVRLALARSVDSIYRQAGLQPAGPVFSITDSASVALLTVIELCEALTTVEYDVGAGTRRLP